MFKKILIAIKGEDTLTNKEIEVMGASPNIDSIVNAAKCAAMKSIEVSPKCKSKCEPGCKKACCLGCKATDTTGVEVKCLKDHSCCIPKTEENSETNEDSEH